MARCRTAAARPRARRDRVRAGGPATDPTRQAPAGAARDAAAQARPGQARGSPVARSRARAARSRPRFRAGGGAARRSRRPRRRAESGRAPQRRGRCLRSVAADRGTGTGRTSSTPRTMPPRPAPRRSASPRGRRSRRNFSIAASSQRRASAALVAHRQRSDAERRPLEMRVVGVRRRIGADRSGVPAVPIAADEVEDRGPDEPSIGGGESRADQVPAHGEALEQAADRVGRAVVRGDRTLRRPRAGEADEPAAGLLRKVSPAGQERRERQLLDDRRVAHQRVEAVVEVLVLRIVGDGSDPASPHRQSPTPRPHSRRHSGGSAPARSRAARIAAASSTVR